MPTIFAMHNTYLDQWFNLGLLGVAVYVYIIYLTVRTAKEAAVASLPPVRGEMIAFVFGMLGLAVSVFFGNLYTSKPYIWMYTGLTMRGAMFVLDKVAEKAEAARAPAPRLGVGVSLRRA